MPKIYEYNGFSFLFYSNDHPPPHCHVKKQMQEMKIKFTIMPNGDIHCSAITKSHRVKFNANELKVIKDFIVKYHGGIVAKWNQFFIQKIEVQCDVINKI